MKLNHLKIFTTQRAIFLILLFFIFLLFSLGVFAASKCKDLPEWKKENCGLDFIFEDPPGGSGLEQCLYQVVSSGITTVDWAPLNGSCTGLGPVTIPKEITIGDGQNCRHQGADVCVIYSLAIDGAGNEGGTSKSLSIDFTAPVVSVSGASADWQNTDAQASVSCDDGEGSGCDSASYRLKTYTSSGSCSTLYSEYTLFSPQTISSYQWVCAVAKDLAENEGFSQPRVEFKVDQEKPVSLITAPPAGSTQTADFNVTVSDTDTGGSGINTSACYYYVFDSGVGQTRSSTLRTCNSTQLITVGVGQDCQTENGTCTVYVYGYDNAGNQSDTNLRSFLIRIDLTPPVITINTPTNKWYNSNPLLDVDFSDDKALDDGFYQVDSFIGIWTAIFTDNTGLSYTTDFRITDATWNGFTDGSSHTIYFKATDDAGNVTGDDGSKFLVIKKDVSSPNVSVDGASANWQNTDAQASVSCTDSYSGCNANSYKLKTYSSNPGTCPTTYTDYTLSSPQTISSHQWLCGAAKDLAENEGFSSVKEFKVDKEKPVSLITAPPADSEQTADFNVTMSDTDTGGSGLDICYYRTYDSTQGWTRDWSTRTCNVSQLITVGPTADCRTIGGTCTVYVYSYDNAGNQSDTNSRSFKTKSADIVPPTTEIKIIRTSTDEDVTAEGTWLRADTYTIEFSDEDPEPSSGWKKCEYSVYACDVGGTNCTTEIVPLTTRDCSSWSFNINAGPSPYDFEGLGRYRIFSIATDNADNSGTDYKYLNFDFTPPETRIE